MNIRRMVLTAIARRVAHVAVALLLGWFVVSDVRAQAAPPWTCPSSNCSIEAAWTECHAWMNYVNSQEGVSATIPCEHQPESARFILQWVDAGGTHGSRHFPYVSACPIEEPFNESTGQCGDSCNTDDPPYGPADSNQGPGQLPPPGQSHLCANDCAYTDGEGGCSGLGRVIDGNAWLYCSSWQPTGNACTVGMPGGGTPPTDSDGDGTSDGEDAAPNNPGSGGDGNTDGDGGEGEDSDCGGESQPDCGEPGSGSGNGNTSGGGADCSSPPHSTGDAILAQIAFQAWATRCAVQGLANEGTGGNVGNGDDNQPDWTEGNPPPLGQDTSVEDVANAKSWGVPLSTDLLDTENIFGEQSCPALPALSIMGHEIDVASFSWWCTLVTIMRACILMMGAFTAIQILLGRM